MGKLVVLQPDGTTRDVILDRERLTIGRRPDNDVCLPFPAVSGEHAQVVTILADSFLEDLGSTNGTIVNGKSIAKHFLNDHDLIDIGRQRLTYLSDNDAKPMVLLGDSPRAQLQGLLDRVPPVQLPQVQVPPSRGQAVARDLDHDLGATRVAMPQVMPRAATPPAPPSALIVDTGDGGSETSRLANPYPTPEADAGKVPSVAAERPAAPAPTVRVLSGASTGRRVPFPGTELTIGRVGVQVAVVRKRDEGYLLIPLEGREPPRINGAPIAPEGTVLHPGDTFEVAGVRLELSADA